MCIRDRIREVDWQLAAKLEDKRRSWDHQMANDKHVMEMIKSFADVPEEFAPGQYVRTFPASYHSPHKVEEWTHWPNQPGDHIPYSEPIGFIPPGVKMGPVIRIKVIRYWQNDQACLGLACEVPQFNVVHWRQAHAFLSLIHI